MKTVLLAAGLALALHSPCFIYILITHLSKP